MTLREKHGGPLAGLAFGAVQIAAQIVSRNRFQVHLLNAVTLVLHLSEDHWMHLRFGRHWQQTRGGKNLLSQMRLASLPLRQRQVYRHSEMRIGVRYVGISRIHGWNLRTECAGTARQQ